MKMEYYVGYEVDDEPSEDESANSSDNDETTKNVFAKQPSAKQVATKFEKEMDNTLNSIINKFIENKIDEQPGVEKEIEYEEESDTDSEAELATGIKTRKKRQHFTNDELFYDPSMDEVDEKWVNEQRATFTTSKTQTDINKNVQKPLDSDAVLNCPCCMTMLCMDCQRHETYKCQYRAMFVFNCKIDESELLKYPKNGKKNQKKSQQNMNDPNSYDEYYAVKCDTCSTKVGVYDRLNELYHFFNVLASH